MANNSTTLEEWNGTSLNPLYAIIFPILTAIVITTNGLVVWSSGLILSQGNRPKRSTYIFLGNLSLTEIINAVVQQIIFSFTLQDISIEFCRVISGLKAAAYTANMFSVGLIAIDRYLFITHGMQYEKWVYPNRARLLILGTWLIGVAWMVPLFWWREPRIHTLKICLPVIFASKTYIFLFILNNLFPLVIVAVSYSVILSKALWKLRQMEPGINENMLGPRGGLRVHVGSVASINEPEENGLNPGTSMWSLFTKSASLNSEKKWKAVKMVLLTALTSIVTWAPFQIAWCVWTLICDDDSHGTAGEPKYCAVYTVVLRPVFFTFALIHDLLTPIIYVWWHKGFKEFWAKRCKHFR